MRASQISYDAMKVRSKSSGCSGWMPCTGRNSSWCKSRPRLRPHTGGSMKNFVRYSCIFRECDEAIAFDSSKQISHCQIMGPLGSIVWHHTPRTSARINERWRGGLKGPRSIARMRTDYLPCFASDIMAPQCYSPPTHPKQAGLTFIGKRRRERKTYSQIWLR